MKGKEALNLKLLPGEPIDGTGRIRIHYLVRDDASGKIVFDQSLTNENDALGGLKQADDGMIAVSVASTFRFKKRSAWRVACNPEQNSLQPQVANGQRYMCVAPPDPLATTCPACLASEDHRAAMRLIEEANRKRAVASGEMPATAVVAAVA